MNKFPLYKLLETLNVWRKRRGMQTLFSWFMVIAGPILIALTVYFYRTVPDVGRSDTVRILLLLDVVYSLIIIALIGFSMTRLIAARRSKSAGSRLHLRLSAAFAVLALIPTVAVAIFAVLTINFGLEGWFSDRVRDVVGSSLSAAEAYKAEQRHDLEQDGLLVAFQLNQLKQRSPFTAEEALRDSLTQLQGAVQRGLKEAYVIDGAFNLIARGQFSYLFGFEQPSADEMELALNGELVIIEDWDNNEFRALVRLSSYVDRFLYVSREVDGEILALLDETQETVKFYNQMENQRDRLLFDFGLIYLAFAAIVILSAIWSGMLFAERLARPVGRLAGAAQRIGAGDLDVRVPEESGDDEIALLSRLFNRMTQQVKRQRDNLIEVNADTERRRRLFDSVLSGVTAGVIGLTSEGKISVMNAAAGSLLNLKMADGLEQPIQKVVPEFTPLFDALVDESGTVQQREISLTRSGKAEVLLVRLAQRVAEDGSLEGYVVTFDDVTNLVAAQRMAAWGDVARRIAHEIKNPLTPIQLSAERVKRKFSPLVGDKQEDLEQYTDVIIRQTNDLRRIVDEFSKFARMPEPRKTGQNLSEILQDAVLLQKPALAPIDIKLTMPKTAIFANIDETMISQALTNLIKNAGEAIKAHQEKEPKSEYTPEIRVKLTSAGQNAEIFVQDNGIGLPKENRSRLFEPYVTHRDEGTGLGLPIVKKIIEEHGGTLELLDAPKFKGNKHVGAFAKICLPLDNALEEEKKTAKVA